MFSLAVIEYLADISVGLKVTAGIFAIVCIIGLFVLAAEYGTKLSKKAFYGILLVIVLFTAIAIFTPSKEFWDMLREMYTR